MANAKKFEPTEKEVRDWNEAEELVLAYQEYINSEDPELRALCSPISEELLKRFNPLFKKYLLLIKHNQIDWNDMEQKSFISLFMDNIVHRRVLNRKVTPISYRADIYDKSNFIKETYGTNSEEDIMNDLYICFLKIAKRYKQMGKNFCAYLYNVFKHEVARMIKAQIKNPLCVPYKNFQYEDYVNNNDDPEFITVYEDLYYEQNTGLPDISWIFGDTCGFEFTFLTSLQRKVLVRYYLEDWSDRQIADSLGVTVSLVNLRRRQALELLCNEFDIDISKLKRTRKSGIAKNKTIKED
jgi:DNA-directed RNA polymerase specialized sigma24 family protein